jgi:uncharacterized protein (DUF1501 family)
MDNSRRKFLRRSAALTGAGLAGNLAWLGSECANAQSLSGYKALVCVFLYGGNDSNNTIVPISNYASYSLVRSVASNIQIPQSQLLPITPVSAPNAGQTFGLHPDLVELAPLYAQGKMAVICNAGTLIAPLTKAQYLAGTNRPQNLFSHSDQQNQWQGMIPGVALKNGWGGRVSDKLLAANAGAQVPTMISVSGASVFNFGQTTGPFVIPSSGGVSLSGTGTDAVSQARIGGVQQLLGTSGTNQLVSSGASILQNALAASSAANPILTATLSPTITTAFTVGGALLNTGMANQLKQVARLIESQAALGIKRQFFFVSLGGFDHHSNLVNGQSTLFNQLSPALAAFYNYTVAAGIANNVTTFTMSDFSRTFIGNGNAGTDHAWGAHHLVIGGAVKGGDFYGTFPTLTVKGPDDSGGNGAWLPTTSVDQIGATLASWFGVAGVDLPYVFPNLPRFATQNLGFV